MTRYWRVALLGFAAMFAQDVIATCMVVFEARLNALYAGLADVSGWLFGLVCMGLAVEEIVRHGWRSRKALTIIVAVSAANFAGTVVGVKIAGRVG